MRLKLDENLGRRAADLLREAGHGVSSVAEQGLQGVRDRSLIERCQSEGRCLVTRDLGFGNPLLFRPTDYPGIAVLRLPSRPTPDHLSQAVATLIGGLQRDEIAGKLWIVQPGRLRQYEPRNGGEG